MATDEKSEQSEPTATPRQYTYAKGTARSTQLVIAAGLVALEGLVAIGFAIVWGYHSFTGSPTDETASIMGAVFAALAGLGLLRMALALWQLEVWPRVPVIVLQLILVPVGFNLAFRLGNEIVGVPLLVVAIGLIALLFSQPVREGYGRDV